MYSRSEAQITRSWQGDPTQPLVSVCCVAFNHRDYIESALDSLLAQETTFPFEILVHDDASTDGTADVIRHYEDTFPGIIRAVLQEENQYSQKPIISPRFLFPLVKGKYVAVCEGDDFWCSNDKLAKQYAALEQEPEADLVFHTVYELDDRSGRQRIVGRHSSGVKRFDGRDIILGGGGFCPTASILFRASLIPDIVDCVENAPVSDKFVQIIASFRGGAVYLPEPMAVYRAGHSGAWTQRMADVARLEDYEQRIAAPFAWLHAHGPNAFADVLKASEADQYLRMANSYSRAGDAPGARRVLATGAELLPPNWPFRGLARWASRGNGRSRIYAMLYPLFRSLFRYRIRLSH